MSYGECIDNLEKAKEELKNEKQFEEGEIEMLKNLIEECITRITDQWSK